MALLVAFFVIAVIVGRASEAACGVGWTDIEADEFPPSLRCIHESVGDVVVEDRTTTARLVAIGAAAALVVSLAGAAVLFRLVAFGSQGSGWIEWLQRVPDDPPPPRPPSEPGA